MSQALPNPLPDNDPIETPEVIFARVVAEIRAEYLSSDQSFPWIIGFSGGKDSTLVAHAVFTALLDISPSRLTRPVHLIANDTLVESPLVVAHLHQSLAEIRHAAETLDLPITVATTNPNPDNTFWVLLIGKGYPSPNSTMRWCTDRLKIQPTSRYILDQVAACGSAIIVLGVRKDESASRKRNVEANQNDAGTRLHPHKDLKGAFVYRPIVDLSTDEVWEILASTAPPWGGTHQRLIKLYRDAAGGECPIVMSQEEAPGCGTNSSRFGCWTCTVVEKDKSLQGFVDSGNRQYEPLITFRDWLREIRNDRSLRQGRRRNGKITVMDSGKLIPGPFTLEARRMILERLLKTQAEYGDTLISEQEIEAIQRIWAVDLIAMHSQGEK
ncbi:MAG: DNA phosphorothioation system sulfurtransferase DndC [Gallionella sp.]|nr:DNA phosphorothioation system sulfurtransferase DndC [Gallionella sp.]